MAQLINSNLVNVIQNTTQVHLNFYDDNTTWLNTIANGIYFNESMAYTFANAVNMNLGMSDEWLGYFSYVTNMSHMCYDCRNLRGNPAVPPRVQNMNAAFYNCLNLDKANVGQSVTDYTESFFRCNNVKQIDIGIADASNFANIAFKEKANQRNITNLTKVQGIAVSGTVQNMAFAFDDYFGLYGTPGCGTNVTNMHAAYRNTGVIGKPVIGNNVLDASYAYYTASNITGDVYCGKNTQNLHMAFYKCNNIWGDVKVGNYATDLSNMCAGCTNLKGNITIGRNAVNITSAFNNCYSITNMITTTNVNSVENMDYAFNNCVRLKGSPLCSSNAVYMNYAYHNCYNITGIAWAGKNVINMSSAFYLCNNLQQSQFTSANLGNCTNMFSAFYGCTNMKGVGAIGNGVTMAPYAYCNCYNITSFDISDVGQSINMMCSFMNCVNAVGNAIIPTNAVNVGSAYSGCNNTTGIIVNKKYANLIGNTAFGTNDTATNLSNVTDIYFSDNVTDAHDCFRAHQTLKGHVNHELDGMMGNSLKNIQGMFSYCGNITGDGWVPDGNITNMNFAYEYARNLDGTAYFGSGIGDSINTRMAFLGCNNITNIEYGIQNGHLGISRAFTNWLADNNASNTHVHTNLSKVEFVNVRNSCKIITQFMDGMACEGSTEAFSFTGRMIGANNITNSYCAFRNCHNYAKNSANKTAICPPKSTNAAGMYEDCWYIENAECTNVVKDTHYMYYNCVNLNCNLNLGTGITLANRMYYNCYKLKGKIPEWFGNCKISNTEYMFWNCRNIDNTCNLIVPRNCNNFDNMYFNLHDRNFRVVKLYSSGTGAGFPWTAFGANEANAWAAANNIKQVWYMNTFDAVPNVNANFFTVSYPGLTKTFKMEWYTGMTDLHLNIPQAAGLFHADPSRIQNTSNYNFYRSNNFANLKNVYIEDYCQNMARFAWNLSMIRLTSLHVDFNNSMMQNMQEAFSVANLQSINGFNFSKNLINAYGAFAWQSYMKANLDNIQYGNKVNNMQHLFANCQNITGNPIVFNNVYSMFYAYQNCVNLNGNKDVVIPNSCVSAARSFENCRNLRGNVLIGSSVTNASNVFYGCSNIVGLKQLSKTNCNYANAFKDCYRMNASLQDYNLENELRDSLAYADNMFYNCTNLHGTAVIRNSMGTWWNIYFNCRNITGINTYGVPGANSSLLNGVFNTIFGSSIMTAKNITDVNICYGGHSTAQTPSPCGLFWYMNNIKNIYIDQNNAQGTFAFNAGQGYTYNSSSPELGIPRDTNYALVNNWACLEKVTVGPHVVNAMRMMCYVRKKFTIEMNNAKNIVNMFDFAQRCFNATGVAYIGNKVQNAACSFEYANMTGVIMENIGANNLNLAYAFCNCPLNDGKHVVVPYRTNNLYRAFENTNVSEITMRPTWNQQNCLYNCRNIKKLHLDGGNYYGGMGASVNLWGWCFGGVGDVSQMTEFTISGSFWDCPNMWTNCNSYKLSPVLPVRSRSSAYAYCNCPNMNPDIKTITTNGSNIRGLFAGTTPCVYGTLKLTTTATSNCDYMYWLNASRTSSTKRLNVYWKKGCHFDTDAMSHTSGGVATLGWGATKSWKFAVADNGWYSSEANIYIYNNLT